MLYKERADIDGREKIVIKGESDFWQSYGPLQKNHHNIEFNFIFFFTS